MIGFLNVGGLVLGLIALILPVISIMRYKNHVHMHWGVLSILSISACSISLYFQIYYIYHKVKISDWPALMDTMYVVVFAATVLLIVTIMLNSITLFLYRNSDRKAK